MTNFSLTGYFTVPGNSKSHQQPNEIGVMEAKIFFHKTCDTQEPQQKSPNAWLNIPTSINAKIL